MYDGSIVKLIGPFNYGFTFMRGVTIPDQDETFALILPNNVPLQLLEKVKKSFGIGTISNGVD